MFPNPAIQLGQNLTPVLKRAKIFACVRIMHYSFICTIFKESKRQKRLEICTKSALPSPYH